MPKFGNKSLEKLKTCDPRLQDILHEAIKIFDFSVLEGHRDEETQNRLVKEGKSKLEWPKSKHNPFPSKAVDIAPYPINWSDKGSFYILAGIVFGIAHEKGIKLRWGGDWDGDWSRSDQTFHDLPHLEIVED